MEETKTKETKNLDFRGFMRHIMYVILGRTGNRISKGEYLVGNAVL